MWEAIYPSLIIFGGTAVAIAAITWIVRRVRRRPSAQLAAENARESAGGALVRLDDAISEADIELGLAGAVYGGKEPAALARARLRAVQVRDDGFARHRALADAPPAVPVLRQRSDRLRVEADRAAAELEEARGQHAAWLRRNADAPRQIAALRRRIAEVTDQLGTPGVREQELADRFADDEAKNTTEPLRTARERLDVAHQALAAAEKMRSDPTQPILERLTDAERALREAERAMQSADQAYEQTRAAAIAAPAEIASVRADIRRVVALQREVPPVAAARLGEAAEKASAAVDALEPRASAEPSAVIAGITRVRDRLDLAVGDARTARARLDGAKNALPGTLATARMLIGRAEQSVAAGNSSEARIRLASARDELARARNADDVVAALDAARRAVRHAEDADALAQFGRAHQF
ncbi:hypothetical protein [Microbacterium sp. ZW T5_56]|uniref:hypothetical protein n=1 Tax=Microbacterium sp. ZW T5_56 TaxID=3378081 RepID=UPI003854A374